MLLCFPRCFPQGIIHPTEALEAKELDRLDVVALIGIDWKGWFVQRAPIRMSRGQQKEREERDYVYICIQIDMPYCCMYHDVACWWTHIFGITCSGTDTFISTVGLSDMDLSFFLPFSYLAN